jgi:hypothetical protein
MPDDPTSESSRGALQEAAPSRSVTLSSDASATHGEIVVSRGLLAKNDVDGTADAAPSVSTEDASSTSKKGLGALLKARKAHLEQSVATQSVTIDHHQQHTATAFDSESLLGESAVEGLGFSQTNVDETSLLVSKTKLQAQQIKYMRMIGDMKLAETSPSFVPDKEMLQGTGNHGSPNAVDFLAFNSALPYAEQLQIMQQALLQERASFQSRIDHLQLQLLESKSLLRSSTEQQSRLTMKNLASSQLIEKLKNQIEDSSNARARHHEETSGLIAGMKSTLEIRMRELQTQVVTLSSCKEKRKQDAAVLSSQLECVRSSLALATDHALAAMRAKAQASATTCEGMQRCLWERSCGWYVKSASGEQQGPMDIQDLNKRLPHPQSRCWCEGFTKWVPYEEAVSVLQKASYGRDGKKNNSLFDAEQFHIAQVCFLHSRTSDALDRVRFADSDDGMPTSAAAAKFSPPPTIQCDPQEMLQAMWATVSQKQP